MFMEMNEEKDSPTLRITLMSQCRISGSIQKRARIQREREREIILPKRRFLSISLKRSNVTISHEENRIQLRRIFKVNLNSTGVGVDIQNIQAIHDWFFQGIFSTKEKKRNENFRPKIKQHRFGITIVFWINVL